MNFGKDDKNKGKAPSLDVIIAAGAPMPIDKAKDVAAKGDAMAAELGIDESDGAAEAPVDVKPIADALGVSEEEAKNLYDAAQELPKTKGKSPEELAKMLNEDVEVMSEVQRLAGNKADSKNRETPMDMMLEGMPKDEAGAGKKKPTYPWSKSSDEGYAEEEE